MWPFGRKRGDRLAAGASEDGRGGGPTEVRVQVVVASPNDVTSPVTGMKAAFFRIAVLEREAIVVNGGMGPPEEAADLFREIGALMLGDQLVFRDDDGTEVTILARRARLGFAAVQHGGTPLSRVPPELQPILQ